MTGFVRPVDEREAQEARSRVADRGGWTAILDRCERLAIEAGRRPYATMLWILLLNASLAVIFVFAGSALFSDPAEFFRELMPGTWLSFAQLLFIAVIAITIQRYAFGTRRPSLSNFWGLSALAFLAFAFVEVTQVTVFLSALLTTPGGSGPFGFRDLDAVLMSILFLAAALLLVLRLRDLLPHRAAIAVLAVGVALGIAMQVLDSTLKATSAEFVAEECLKLASEVFFIGGYLVILHSFLQRDRGGNGAGRNGHRRSASQVSASPMR